MLTLVRLARTVDGGLDILDGSMEEAIEIASRAQRIAERRRARRMDKQGLSVKSDGNARAKGLGWRNLQD